MVARMKKFTFLVFHRDYDRFLHELRELGMIHVVEKEEAALNREELHQFIAESKLLKEARKTLEKVVDKKTFTPTDQPSVARGMEIPAAIAGIEAEKSALTQAACEHARTGGTASLG